MPAKKLVVSTYLQYIIIGLGTLVLAVFLWQISAVLLTFLAAAVLAYALNPVVRRLERWRVPRSLAVLGVFLVLIVSVVAGLLIIIVPAIGQVQGLIREPQAIVQQVNNLVNQLQGIPYVGERIAELDQERVLQLLRANAPSPGQVFGVATGLIGGVFGVFGTLLNLLLMVLVSVYLLLDRERITRATIGMIPGTVRDQAVELFYAVEQTLMKYLRGQLLLCIIMGVLGWAIMFFTVGDYALLVGVWVGVTEIIPVLGAFLGAVPAVLIALLTGGFTEALIVAGLFLVAQQIEGNILVPRVQGGSVGVHPLWVLFATIAGTALYGLVGAIFAVPIVAIIAATIRYLRGTLIFERWSKAPVKPAAESVDEDALPEAQDPRPTAAVPGTSRGSARDPGPKGPEKE